MGYSIFVILGITATLLVASLAMFFKAGKKPKSFGIYFIIPICLGLMAIIGLSFGLSSEINYNKLIEESHQDTSNFIEDYSYYVENWADVIEYCENNEVDFTSEYNLEPSLDQEKLKHTVVANDAFYTYFLRYYSCLVYSDNCLGLRVYLQDQSYDYIDFYVYRFSSDYYYGTPSFLNESKLNEALDNIALVSAESGVESLHTTVYIGSGFSITEYIIMIVYVSLIVIFDFVSMIYFFVRRKGDKQTTGLVGYDANTTINKDNALEEQINTFKETPPPPPKPTWEELNKKEQKTFIEQAIKNLYTEQLSNEKKKNILSREQRALRRTALEDNEFLIEDLTETEKQQVLENAKNLFENNIDDSLDIESRLDEALGLKTSYKNDNQYLEGDNGVDKINNTIEENSKLTKTQIKEKYREKYLKSKRRITDIIYYIFMSLGITGLAGATITAIVFGLVGLTDQDLLMSVIIAPYTIGFISMIIAGIAGTSRGKYCKYCGTKGVVVSSNSESHYAIERNSKGIPRGLLEDVITTKHYECRCCGNVWTTKFRKRNRS